MIMKSRQVAFTLPVVVVSSVVMLSVLVLALQMVSGTSKALRDQYYNQIAREAAEAGAVYASNCILSGVFTTTLDITPATNCSGSVQSSYSSNLVDTGRESSRFSVRIEKIDDKLFAVSVNGVAELRVGSSGAVERSVSHTLQQQISLERDPKDIRASQRWWGFGNNAIFDFGASGIGNPLISRGAGEAGEGSATISDLKGNLLFQTNGLQIWDKTGAVMQNSTGLIGAKSATQAVAAFPFDDSYRTIGVVTNNSVQEGIGAGELYMSVIDMSLNGGRGAIVAGKKNIRLGGGTLTQYANEGVGAMPSNIPGQFWVYAHNVNTNRVTRFRVSSNGVEHGPVAQSVAAPYRCSTSRIGYGSFSFSSDYSKMLLYVGAFGCLNSNSNGGEDSGQAYIYSVSPSSGSLSQLASWRTRHASTEGSGYFADFSPAEKYVYVSRIYPGRITRYDIRTLSSTSIKSSEHRYSQSLSGNIYTETYYNTPDMQGGGQIRRAPNGKMYIANHAYVMNATPRPCKMSVIHTPDNATAAVSAIGLVVDGVTLATNSCSTFGLPQMATAYRPKMVLY